MEKIKLVTYSTLMVILTWAMMPSSSFCSYKCNTKLLNTFRIKGLKYSVSEEMEICPTVKDTCCSMFDQVEILQLWRKTSFHRVQNHYVEMEKWDDKVLKMYYKFLKLDKSDIIYAYESNTDAPYIHNFCTYKRIPMMSYPADVLAKNMEYMLPGVGPIKSANIKQIRMKAYRDIKASGVDKNDPSYRFKQRSAKKFYVEFYHISNLMYHTRRLPYYHKKYLEAKARFKRLKMNGAMPSEKKYKLPSDKIRVSRTRKKMLNKRKKKTKKPETYRLVDTYSKDFNDDIDYEYKRYQESKPDLGDGVKVKGGRGGKGKGRGGGRKKRKRRKKRGRKLAYERKLNQTKEKGQNGENKNKNPGTENSTGYADEPIEELKVKRRRKRMKAKKSDAKSMLKYKMRVDFKRRKHRRKLSKKYFHKKNHRKLKDLKGKIARQWNQVFGQGQPPLMPQQAPNQQPQTPSKSSKHLIESANATANDASPTANEPITNRTGPSPVPEHGLFHEPATCAFADWRKSADQSANAAAILRAKWSKSADWSTASEFVEGKNFGS